MKRALLFVILLATSLLVIPPVAATAAGTCTVPFATAGYPPGWKQVSDTPDNWTQTDGVVWAADFLYTPGGPFIVVGGNFTKLVEPNGTQVPARNLGVVRLSDGKVVWGATSMTGYVKAIQARNGVTYVAGSFTAINGIARKQVAAFSAYSYGMLPWAPVVTQTAQVRSIQASDAGVLYVAGDSSVMAFSTSSAARLWTMHADNGPVMTLLLSPDQQGLYVGGFFSGLDGGNIPMLVAVYPINSHKVDPGFNPHLRPNSTVGNYDGEIPMSPAWDTSIPGQLRLSLGTGGGLTNTVQSINPFNGAKYWTYNTEGDTQALAMVGNTILTGFHRSHGNLSGCPFWYYGTQWASNDPGYVLPWNPGLSGKPSTSAGASKQNGGIEDIIVDSGTRKVYVLGDFSFYGQTCNYDLLQCTGGSPRRGIARYSILN